jgi:hypothetical protein
MTYEEYIDLRKMGKIRAGIDNSTALKLIDYLPKRYQYAHYFWSWVWILSIPGFICVAIFIKWWVGLLLLFFVTPLIFKSTKKSAAQFVLEYAEQNKEFFEELVKNNILTFKY